MSAQTSRPSESRIDLPTLIAIAVLASAIDNVVHEAFGHGGAALLVGAKPTALSSAWWLSNDDGLGPWALRAISAGGTFANLLLGGALVALRRPIGALRRRNPRLGLFLWLLTVMNLLSGGGYMLADPIGGFGDWTGFLVGLSPHLPIAAGIVALGLAISFGALRFGARELQPFLGEGEAERKRRSRILCLVPYVTNSLLLPASAILNPGGTQFVFTNALATLGGTCWLVWVSFIAPKFPHPADAGAPLAITRSRAWIAGGLATAAFMVLVLGPGIRFSKEPLDFASIIDLARLLVTKG